MRCPSRYPGAVTLRDKPVRCELAAGHPGQHGHSFAARYWDELYSVIGRSVIVTYVGSLPSARIGRS